MALFPNNSENPRKSDLFAHLRAQKPVTTGISALFSDANWQGITGRNTPP
jgi:hypothetical protein